MDSTKLTNKPKISVIVAVYNQEHLVSKCIESILNQSFHDLELILINDGSQDNSKEVIDSYAKQDSRIKAIHQDNVGLAEVRNIGIRASRGEYIGFVDGDDWVEEEMYETLYNLCIQHDAHISSCLFNTYNENYELYKEDSTTKEINIYDSDEAIKLTYEHRFTSLNVWNKLFKRELFDRIMFPSFRAYEDEAILAQLYSFSNKIVVIDYPYYNHYQRQSGITRSILNKFSERKLDILTNYIDTYSFVEKHHPHVCELVTFKHYRSCIDILMYILKDEAGLKGNYKHVKYLSEHMKIIVDRFKENRYLTRKEKVMAIIIANIPIVGITYYRINNRLRVRNAI